MYRCIVIGGYGRSGTSIVRDVLCTSPKVFSFGAMESKFFTEPYGLIDLFRGVVTDYSVSRGTTAIQEFQALMRTHLPDHQYFGQASILDALAGKWVEYRDLVDDFTGSLRDGPIARYLTDEEFFERVRGFVSRLLELIEKRSENESVFVEKTPHNAHNPWVFNRIFDRPKFVWIVRDPRAVVYSLSKQEWFDNDLRKCCVWVRHVLRRFSDQASSVPNMSITLEGLADDPLGGFEEISSYCDLDGVSPEAIFDSAKVHDWRNYLVGDDLALVEELLKPEIEQFRSGSNSGP